MKNRLSSLFLTAICFVFISNINNILAQCPEPNNAYSLNGQAEVNAFLATHPDCEYLFELELVGDITDISGFITLQSLDYLYITACPNLTDLDGFSNVDTIYNNLGFYQESGFTDLCGLQNLQLIGGDLRLESGSTLTSLRGLENVTVIGDDITIDDCPNLINLDGLENLAILGGSIDLTNNPALDDCCGIQNIINLNPGIDVSIENNGANCNNLAEIAALNCSPPDNPCAIIDNVSSILPDFIKIYPNPASQFIKLETPDPSIIEVFKMYDIMGQEVLRITNPNTLIDLGSLIPGMYISTIQLGHKIYSKKLLIE